MKSITFDNALAFANHYNLKEDLKIKTYFTHPYASQEKGTVESRIGVIRWFFPKGTNFTKVTNDEVRDVEKKLNNHSMRMFNYESPKEVYERKILLRS